MKAPTGTSLVSHSCEVFQSQAYSEKKPSLDHTGKSDIQYFSAHSGSLATMPASLLRISIPGLDGWRFARIQLLPRSTDVSLTFEGLTAFGTLVCPSIMRYSLPCSGSRNTCSAFARQLGTGLSQKGLRRREAPNIVSTCILRSFSRSSQSEPAICRGNLISAFKLRIRYFR
jgi:hypothetical protein